MSRTASPLRYPGGKSALQGLVTAVVCANDMIGANYAEPFAGGCGLALSLLFASTVGEVHLNDIDPAISCLWNAILHHTEEFVERIEATPITIDEWHHQRENYRAGQRGSVVDLGFATLFLNRTNRSGIIKGAGVIGGLRQTGNYLLDCRFNKADIIKRIRRIAKYRSRIHFTSLDALEFIQDIKNRANGDVLLMADPPYYHKGADLYTSFYKPADHAALADVILRSPVPWMTTYDNCPEISGLYRSCRQFSFDIQYSVQTKRLGSELLIVSDQIRLPEAVPLIPFFEN